MEPTLKGSYIYGCNFQNYQYKTCNILKHIYISLTYSHVHVTQPVLHLEPQHTVTTEFCIFVWPVFKPHMKRFFSKLKHKTGHHKLILLPLKYIRYKQPACSVDDTTVMQFQNNGSFCEYQSTDYVLSLGKTKEIKTIPKLPKIQSFPVRAERPKITYYLC